MLSPPAELLPASSDPRPQSEFESDVTPVVSRSVSPSPAHPGDPTNKSKKKTVLVFLGSKSKRTRALLSQIAQKRKDKKRARRDSKTTSVTRAQSLPVTPVSSSDNNNMQHHMNEAHMNELRQRLESNNQNRRGTYDRQLPQKPAKPVSKQRSYEPNPYNAYNGNNHNHNPYKISTEYIKRASTKIPSKPHPKKKKHSDDTSPHRHNKSRSHVLPSSTHNKLEVSRSKSPQPRSNGRCPYCRRVAPVLQFITARNRHSQLTELRDKLSVIEQVATLLKQEISEIQNRSNSDSNLHVSSSKVSNPILSESSQNKSYLLHNLNTQQQQSLSLLTTQKKITFPIKGTAMISPQDNTPYFDKFKEMRRRFVNQEFFVGLDSERATFAVHTKMKATEASGKQYRQIRSFSSLSGAEFESANDNVLKIWFNNTRGYFLMSFASETEANTVLNLINIIVNNEEFCSVEKAKQLVWASYIDKKGKRMRLYSQKFLCLIKLDVKLYKTHINYTNGEEPSLSVNLMDCDLGRDKKEIKFTQRNQSKEDRDKVETLLSIKLSSEIERDDFLNLCAQTLGKAIQKGLLASPEMSMSGLTMDKSYSHNVISNDADDNDTGSDIEDSYYEAEQSEYRAQSIGVERDDADNEEDVLAIKSMTMTLRGPPLVAMSMGNMKNKAAKHATYLTALSNTPRMYGAGLQKALDRLAKRRPSDIDFIETTFRGDEIMLTHSKNTYQLLDVLGKSMISGAFLNKRLFLHKAVWEQNKVMVINYEKKLEVFQSILDALNELFDEIDVDWLKADFGSNSKTFHSRLTTCEKKLRDAQSRLTTFINKSEQKAHNKGAAKFLNKFKDKSRVKVFDNQPYRDLIFQICGHASAMQLYHKYLMNAHHHHHDNKKMLLNDIKGITVCMGSFGRVVVHDTKEFLWAYLRRGAKNIYQ
eukprot:693396_1